MHDSELYRVAEINAYDLGNGYYLVSKSGDEPCAVLPAAAIRVAQSCRHFRSIAEHARGLSQDLGPDKVAPEQATLILTDLASRGLLVSLSQALGPLAPPLNTESPSSLSSIVVMTADRPGILGDCLNSYLASGKKKNTPLQLLLMDDSRRDGASGDNEKTLSRIAASDNLLRYSGRSDRARYAQALIEAGIAPELATFCVMGDEEATCTTGASRNAALLDTIGERFLMADDDTICRTAIHPEPEPGIVFGSHEDPSDFWFFDRREKAVASAEWRPLNLLDEHGKLLGRTLAELKTTADVRECCQHVMARAVGGTGVVRLTRSGVVGDLGVYSSVGLLLHDLPGIKQMFESEQAYRTAMTSREVIRVPRRTTITHRSGCVAMSIGIDHRSLVPPFLPAFRNQDGVFGALLATCFLDAFVGHIPVAIFHNAESGRVYQRIGSEAWNCRLSEIIISLIGLCALPAGLLNPADRLHAIGIQLREIGKLPREDFVEYVKHAIRIDLVRLFRSNQLKLARPSNRFLSWQRDLERVHNELLQTVKRSECWIPLEFRHLPPEIAVFRAQRFVQRTAQLLDSWVHVVDIAEKLAQNGIRPSRSVN